VKLLHAAVVHHSMRSSRAVVIALWATLGACTGVQSGREPCEGLPAVLDARGVPVRPSFCLPRNVAKVVVSDGKLRWHSPSLVLEQDMRTATRRVVPWFTTRGDTLLDGDFLYFTDCGYPGCTLRGGNPTIVRLSLREGRRDVVSSDLSEVTQLAIFDEDVCWRTMAEYSDGGEVECVERRGGSVRKLFAIRKSDSAPKIGAARGPSLYVYMPGGRLLSLDRRGGNPSRLLQAEGGAIEAVAVDEKGVFWVACSKEGSCEPSTLWRASGEGPPEQLPVSVPSAVALASDGVNLYWTSRSAELWRLDLASMDAKVIARVSGDPGSTGRDASQQLIFAEGQLWWSLRRLAATVVFRIPVGDS